MITPSSPKSLASPLGKAFTGKKPSVWIGVTLVIVFHLYFAVMQSNQTLCPLTRGESGLDAAKITQETRIPYEVGTYLGTKVLPLALSAFLQTDHQC